MEGCVVTSSCEHVGSSTSAFRLVLVAFVLEALGLTYETKYLDFKTGEHKVSIFERDSVPDWFKELTASLLLNTI